MELEYVRPLPPELLVEMHKCLPLDNQIYVLVNVSKTFVINNSTRMHRNIQRIKTSLNEYIGTLVNGQNNQAKLMIYKEIEWKPELDALFRYGSWLTTTRKFEMPMDIVGTPKNFVEKLLLHMAYSCSAQMMLHRVEMNLEAMFPIPTFMKPLLNKKKEHYQIGHRILFESIQLETDNGQILHIFDGELIDRNNYIQLRLFVKNEMDGKNWFQILIDVDSSQKFIRGLEFSKWNMQSFDDIANFINGQRFWNNNNIKQNDNKLVEAKGIYWSNNLDLFLRRGAGFSQFRHFTMNQYYTLNYQSKDYVDFLINSIANTKYPEEFLEPVEMNLKKYSSLSINKISAICHKGIPKDGNIINFDGNKLHILSAKTKELNNKLEFTLANTPTNGQYLFDVDVQFKREGSKIVKGIKIQKRKVADNIEMKCYEQIGQGKKRKAAINDEGEDEDKPTCSSKLMKK